MAGCNIKISRVFDGGNIGMNLYEHNQKAYEDNKPYFAYGQVIFMTMLPWRFDSKYSNTGFFKVDLVA